MDYSYRGKSTLEFESILSDYIGSYVVCTNTGTSALHLALLLSGVKAHDYALCPSISYVSTANVILYDCSTGGANMQFSFTRFKSAGSDEIAVENPSSESDVYVYPNPSGGNFTIDLSSLNADENISIKIIDMQGWIIYNTISVAGDNKEMNVSLEPGIYMLVMEQSQNTIIRKLLIE